MNARKHDFHWGILGAAISFAAVFALCGCTPSTITDLHPANVPVRPLAHPSGDPTGTFREEFPLQVAAYWTKPDEGKLEIQHSLGAMGIPFFITRDLKQALRHRLVILYPSVDGHTFSDEQIGQLTRFVQNGGCLLAENVVTGGLKALFGFHDYSASRRRYKVTFTAGADPALRYLTRPEELEIRLGDPKYGDIYWTNGLAADPSATVLARFDDGTAAVLRNTLGKGSTYLLGVSVHDAVLRNQANRDYDAERHYVNTFEPGTDVWLLLLRGWYESRQPGAVRLATIPGGQSSVLLLSHDVDWGNSFAPSLDYAKLEAEHHVRSTFFIQTKYVSDYNSRAFFYGKNLDDLKSLAAQGFSIGSHSVIHSRGFNKADLGTGDETYATYRPQGTGFESFTGATVFGEVRVPKELLDGEIPGQRTIFFRAGHLRVPQSLPEALQRTGYEFDSSFTANDVLTNFPYALPLGLLFEEDSGLYEFPVTFEDEEMPPLRQRVDAALDVIRSNATIGGVNVLLIHPNQAGDKLMAEKEILERLPADVSAMDLQSFATFWRARDHLQWSVVKGRTARDVILNATADEPVSGITFEFTREIAAADDNAKVLADKHRIVLPELKANQKIAVLIRYSE
jgi:hypothetical protein